MPEKINFFNELVLALTVSKLIDERGKVISNASEIAENFNDYFANIAFKKFPGLKSFQKFPKLV